MSEASSSAYAHYAHAAAPGPAMRYRDRRDAGRQLAPLLWHHRRGAATVVLALPRGGVPVAAEVAQALDLPLDLLAVHKVCYPGQSEVALGAVAGIDAAQGDWVQVSNPEDAGWPVPPEALRNLGQRASVELARQTKRLRGDRPTPLLRGRTVLLVDDGLATGATMRAAIEAVQQSGARRVVAALPVADAGNCSALHAVADEVVCAWLRQPLRSVGDWYQDFEPVSDAQIQASLAGKQPC